MVPHGQINGLCENHRGSGDTLRLSEYAPQMGGFRRFHATEIAERSYKLDITWLKDESLESSDDLPDPQDLATEAITELEAIVGDLREIVALIEQEEGIEA